MLSACAGSDQYKINLMPAPAVFADGDDEQIRKKVRIGNVIIIGGDFNREGFGAALTDGMLRIPERLTVYVLSTDRALTWSRRIFRHKRLGQMFAENLPPRALEFLRANPSLELIDVTEAAGSTRGNGHNYFSKSPWISSDLFMLLAHNIDAAPRGLVKEGNLPLWTFPPRLHRAVAKGAAGART